MATKTITVTEKAYNILKGLKAEKESFSETITRIGEKGSLDKFIGVLSKDGAVELEKAVMKTRSDYAKGRENRIKNIREALENGRA